MKRFTGAVLGVLALAGAANAFAAEQGVPVAKVTFDQRTYEVYQDWIAQRDNVNRALRNVSGRANDEKMQYWIDTCMLEPARHDTEDGKHVLTFTSGELEPEPARSSLRTILQTNFVKRVSAGDLEAMKGAREKIEREMEHIRREMEKIRERRGKLTQLRSNLSRDVRQEKASIKQALNSANLRIAELEARLESINKRLAQEKPVLKSTVVEGSTDGKILELMELMVKASIQEAEVVQGNIGSDSDRHMQFMQDLDKTRIEMISMLKEFARSVQGRINPVYQKLKEMLIDAETEYAGILAQRNVYEDRKARTQKAREEADKIQTQINELDDELGAYSRTLEDRGDRLASLRDEFPLEQPVIEWLDIPQV